MFTGRNSNDEIRRDVRRRLAVGLSGLLVMFLLVLLGGLLARQARQSAVAEQAQATGTAAPAGAEAGTGNQPLVDLGVAPSLDEAEKAPSATVPSPAPPMPRTAGNGAVIVPDLQPDPELQPAQRQR